MKTLIVSLILMHLGVAHAQLDNNQSQGLHDTQKLLKSKQERGEFIKKNKNAQDADDKAGAIAGSEENKEEIYGLSSEVMEKITKEANGDPAKMQAILTEAQKNPQAFYDKYFSASQKAKIKSIAGKSPKSSDLKPAD